MMTMQQRLAKFERALRRIEKISKCETLWMSYPKNTTCLDVRDHAMNRKNGYDEDYRKNIINGDSLCKYCKIKFIARGALK